SNQPMDDGTEQEAPVEGQSDPGNDKAADSLASMATGGDVAGTDQAPVSSASQPKAELITWIRETRRMRSEEVHFLDSPTIGVLVFFKKIEE
ncbi:MAG: CsiV family protein, partial [Marinobacter sp.]